MVRTAIILYTVRELEAALDQILDRIGAAGYDGVQMVGDPGTASVQFPEALTQRDLGHAGRHLSIETLTEEREETATLLAETGCEHVVIPYLDEEYFESVDAVERTATKLDRLAEDFADHGISLHYHNHAHEFVECEERTAFEVLLDRTNRVGFELDVGWAAAGGADPVSLLAEIGERGPLVHMKDVQFETETESDEVPQAGRSEASRAVGQRGTESLGQPSEARRRSPTTAVRNTATPAELGEGELAVDRVARVAREHADWLIYEHDRPRDPIDSIEHGAEVLEKYR